MDNYLKRLPLALFSGYVLKLLILGSNLTDAPIVLVLAAVYAYLEYKSENKQILELKQELSHLNDKIDIAVKSADDAKTSIAGVKISQGFRPAQVK